MSKKLPITSRKAVKITKKSKKPSARIPAVSDDFKSAALVVSVMVNLFVLVGWSVLAMNHDYVAPVANALFAA